MNGTIVAPVRYISRWTLGAVRSLGKGSLGRLISDTAFAIRAEGLLEELNLLMQDLRANPRKYVRLSIF